MATLGWTVVLPVCEQPMNDLPSDTLLHAAMYGISDTLHWQKGPHKWAWGHFALAKRPAYMGMGLVSPLDV